MYSSNDANFFQLFSSLSIEKKQAIVEQYKKKFLDFDNDVIVNSAAEVLVSLLVPRERFLTLQVGPDRAGNDWSLATQLQNKLKPSDYSRDYIFFSIPTYAGKHSIPVVICKSKKSIYCIDPLASRFLDEAHAQLSKAIALPELQNYKVVTPPKNYVAQQADQWSCGIHSTVDIIGMILFEEIELRRILDPRMTPASDKDPKLLIDTIIDIRNGSGISQRSVTDRDNYLGILCMAYAAYGHKHSAKLDDPRLENRKYKCLDRLARDINVTTLPPNISAKDLSTFKEAAAEAKIKTTNIVDAINTGREAQPIAPLSDFIKAFILKNPNTPFKPLLENDDFLKSLPQTMNDDVGQCDNLLASLYNKTFSRPELLSDKASLLIAKFKALKSDKPYDFIRQSLVEYSNKATGNWFVAGAMGIFTPHMQAHHSENVANLLLKNDYAVLNETALKIFFAELKNKIGDKEINPKGELHAILTVAKELTHIDYYLIEVHVNLLTPPNKTS